MNILTQKSSLTISSLQISEMLASRHDKVKQSIERLSIDNEKRRAVITLPPLGEASFRDLSGRTQHTTAYMFSDEQGKRDSIIVVAQLSPEFTAALVDRWQELEKQQAQPVFQIPQTLGEALQLAANQALQIEQAKPKVDHYNAVVECKGLLNATQVGLKLGMSAIALNRVLEELGVYNCSVKRSRVFKQAFVNKGYGVLKQTEQGKTQSLFTTLGEAWVIEKLQ
ncbi:phage antirepressor KilAC domain-containing protein [Psychrobacter sp. van23A]|uniref:phage antirepressor KilAC domain-containing protein n=1 Tax=Psychrobacter sp. van23A TaxID=3064892 RepID=UPI0027B959EF|nr:phage antirepressor KilAC domain-containing protein [Psychrobacter sp. van23A]WLW65229.1 Rha family transcriptional regulator [Psychrobacter sp. van23A]